MRKTVVFRKDDIDTLLFYIFLGVVLGGRLGYILLYNPLYFLENPNEILAIWRGGMSFHGGCLGVILAVYIFSLRKKYHFWHIIDHLAIIIPVALGLGRIGNYINNELPGYSPYNGPFGMILDGVSHFPSPLLEMILEGGILFILMVLSWKFLERKMQGKELTPGILSAVFLIGYSSMRLIAEGFRLPDVHIGYLGGTSFLTLGIIYTIPMLLLGIIILIVQMRKLYLHKSSSRQE